MFPKLITFGEFFLPTYGVLVALGFLVGLLVTTRLGKRVNMDQEKIVNLVVYCALAGLIGAKLLMFAFDWDHFRNDPADMFSFNTLRAAGVFQGGLVLAVITAFVYSKRNGMALPPTFDVFAPGIAIGHAIGRVGCFMAGCCWGKECDLPWAITFNSPDAHDLTGVPLHVRLHPAQLYEVGTETLLFGFLYWRFGRQHRPGTIIGMYLIYSSIARFAIEFVRNHEQALPFGLPLSITQWIAIGLTGLGTYMLLNRQGSGAPVSGSGSGSKPASEAGAKAIPSAAH
jgi:phosphatidylglycerol:prolipoprotein diacylglycerol transferase